jgi:anti-anti-sigma factor
MSHTVAWPSHLSVATVPGPDGNLLFQLAGEIDVESGPAVRAAITEMPASTPGAVLDMADVTLVSAAGFRGLTAAAAHLADDGRQVLLARCRPRVLAVLHHLGASGVVRMVDTVDEALAALAPAEPLSGGDELAWVRSRARALPGLLQTRPVIEGATVLVRDRYHCPDKETAFALLRESSQRHNIKLRTLAAAVLTARPPAPGSPVWFAGRRRCRPPAVTFRPSRREWRDSRSAFLADVLDTALSWMDTDRGDLALADPVVGGLRLEVDHGLPRAFTAAFAHVDVAATGGTETSARAQALRSGTRVVVADVVTSPMYTNPLSRTAMLAARARAVQSTPLVVTGGRCVGTLSTLDSNAGRTPSADEAAGLDRIARDAGRWLAWHERTVVLDALEYLHQTARLAGW